MGRANSFAEYFAKRYSKERNQQLYQNSSGDCLAGRFVVMCQNMWYQDLQALLCKRETSNPGNSKEEP